MQREEDTAAAAPIMVYNEDVEEINDNNTHQLPQTTLKRDNNSDPGVTIASSESFEDDIPNRKTLDKSYSVPVPPTRDDSLTIISEDAADGSMGKYDSLDRTPKVSTISGYGTTSKRRASKVEPIVA